MRGVSGKKPRGPDPMLSLADGDELVTGPMPTEWPVCDGTGSGRRIVIALWLVIRVLMIGITDQCELQSLVQH